MKLRNKKTGMIDYLVFSSYPVSGDIVLEYVDENSKSGYSEYRIYKTLAELNKEWEDYTPTEPLIKDKKIRKAVRAWTGIFDEISLRAVVNEDFISLFCDIEHYSASPEMDISPESFGGGVISDRYYTIAELCGEEEE